MVMIGIDPHKRTYTAVAIDTGERVLDERLVRATSKQVPELLEWVKRLDGGDRIWAIESVGGLGYLLAQQLLAAGEHVVDIPATLASRVRLLGTGRSDKNDPNDARSVAIAALRAAELVPVRVEDHASVLRLVSRRHTPLGWSYNKTACRLHALVADLVPGGISNQVVVCQARSLLADHPSVGAVAVERHALALDPGNDSASLRDLPNVLTTGAPAQATHGPAIDPTTPTGHRRRPPSTRPRALAKPLTNKEGSLGATAFCLGRLAGTGRRQRRNLCAPDDLRITARSPRDRSA